MNIVSRRSRTQPPASLSTLFALYVSRLVRQHLLAQFADPGHPVLTTERVLVQQAASRLKAHLSATPPTWDLCGRLGTMVVTTHIRGFASTRFASRCVRSLRTARPRECARGARRDREDVRGHLFGLAGGRQRRGHDGLHCLEAEDRASVAGLGRGCPHGSAGVFFPATSSRALTLHAFAGDGGWGTTRARHRWRAASTP
jgi:hypothetical protein